MIDRDRFAETVVQTGGRRGVAPLEEAHKVLF